MSDLRLKPIMHVCANPNGAFPFRTHNKTNSVILDENDVVQNMHDFCVRVYVCLYMLQYVQEMRRVAIRVHFIVWGLSPVLKGALYWGSGALDGAKNLSLRAGTDSQCIVGLLHLSFGILVICWRTRSAGFQSADAGGINTDGLCKFPGNFLREWMHAFFLKWRFLVGLIHANGFTQHFIWDVAASKSPERLSNNHNARIPTLIIGLYCTIEVLLFLYQYVGKHLVWSIYCIMCNSK